MELEPNSRMPKIMIYYGPMDEDDLEKPLKRLLDKAKTGLLRPNY
jgi:hypothetical protein